MQLSRFTKEHFLLCVCTLGTAILGYLGYHAITWIINKCSRTEKVDSLFKNITDSPQWKQIANSLSEFKKNWKHLAETEEARKIEVSKLQASYDPSKYKMRVNHSIYNKPLGAVYAIPGNFSMWMPGVALVAAYLKEKKKIEGLYVCGSLESLSDQINQISLSPENQRCAFVVGAFSSGLKQHFSVGFEPNFPQHKAVVCVEKKEGQLTIALIDPQPEMDNKEISPENLTLEQWAGYDKQDKFNAQELVFRAILSACRKSNCRARLLHSQVPREKIYGCETFALQDAVAYLQDPEFFNRIKCSEEKKVRIDEKHEIEVITSLPAEYMTGSQSSKIIEDYRNQGGEFDKKLIGKKKTLQNYLELHSLEGEDSIGRQKKQNHYITKKSFKYLNLVSLFLKHFKPLEIEQIARKVLR